MDPVVTQSPAEPIAAAPVAAPSAPATPSVEQLVEDWFRRHFNGLGARLDESLHNALHAAKEDLKKILSAL